MFVQSPTSNSSYTHITMAQNKCQECRKFISSNGGKCTHCGCNNQPKVSQSQSNSQPVSKAQTLSGRETPTSAIKVNEREAKLSSPRIEDQVKELTDKVRKSNLVPSK